MAWWWPGVDVVDVVAARGGCLGACPCRAIGGTIRKSPVSPPARRTVWSMPSAKVPFSAAVEEGRGGGEEFFVDEIFGFWTVSLYCPGSPTRTVAIACEVAEAGAQKAGGSGSESDAPCCECVVRFLFHYRSWEQQVEVVRRRRRRSFMRRNTGYRLHACRHSPVPRKDRWIWCWTPAVPSWHGEWIQIGSCTRLRLERGGRLK